jgi:hypothetical protein
MGVEAARQQQSCAVCRRINEKFPACNRDAGRFVISPADIHLPHRIGEATAARSRAEPNVVTPLALAVHCCRMERARAGLAALPSARHLAVDHIPAVIRLGPQRNTP